MIGWGKNADKILVTLTPYPRSQDSLDCWKMAGKWLVCILSPKGMGGFWPNLHSYIVGTWKRTDYILVTFTPFSRSHKGLDYWKMAWLHPSSWRNEWILTKLIHLYYCDIEKNWLDFGDLNPNVKVIQGLRVLENGLSTHFLMKEWIDFDQTCTAILLWYGKKIG